MLGIYVYVSWFYVPFDKSYHNIPLLILCMPDVVKNKMFKLEL